MSRELTVVRNVMREKMAEVEEDLETIKGEEGMFQQYGTIHTAAVPKVHALYNKYRPQKDTATLSLMPQSEIIGNARRNIEKVHKELTEAFKYLSEPDQYVISINHKNLSEMAARASIEDAKAYIEEKAEELRIASKGAFQDFLDDVVVRGVMFNEYIPLSGDFEVQNVSTTNESWEEDTYIVCDENGDDEIDAYSCMDSALDRVRRLVEDNEYNPEDLKIRKRVETTYEVDVEYSVEAVLNLEGAMRDVG